MPEPEALACESCGTEIAPGLLNCPACHRLVHSDRLKRLAGEADEATAAGDHRAALVAWREALELLPAGSRQYEVIAGRVAELGRKVDEQPLPASASGSESDGTEPAAHGHRAGIAGLGALGLAIWKFKFAVVFALTKAKFLLVGLTKASTVLSMVMSVGVYWTVFGWRFALGLVLSIYVHEMGHVFVLNRYGVKAEAPMFIPGLGAMIRLRQVLTDPRQDAMVGLAGPIWGLGAAVFAWSVALATGSPAWAAIAKLGAWINLFNLLPLWQLDGGRAFRALSRSGRWFSTFVIAAAWSLTEESLLVLLLLAAVYRTLTEPPPPRSDRVVLANYALLVAALSAMTLIPVALP
jgi:Zn-dependent protease